MFIHGDADTKRLVSLFHEDRDWFEYDEYRETPPPKPGRDNSTTVEIVRDGEVLWSNVIFPHTISAFSLEERERWSVAEFRHQVADAITSHIAGILAECTDRTTRKALKKKSRAVSKRAAPEGHFGWRMRGKDARAERKADEAASNEKASAWLRQVPQ